MSAAGLRPDCPVCRDRGPEWFIRVEARDYWRCGRCEARFLDPEQRPDADEERTEYLQHDNQPDDPGYRRFLSQLAVPLLAKLEPASQGLDYGCGPGPALAALLHEAGHDVSLYDPFFKADLSVLARSYDFIACSETAEHFHDPAGEFERFGTLLRPGGWLGVLTCFQTDDARFADWHYRRDPTHVVFYRDATFRWLAGAYDWSFESPDKDVVLMRKPG